MIDETEYRLLRLGYIAGLPHEEKLTALKLIQRGADATLLYFWFNVTHRNYAMLPQTVLYNDADRMIKLYREFTNDILTWVNPILSQHYQLQPSDYGRQAS